MIITDIEYRRSRRKSDGIDGNIDSGVENSKAKHRKVKMKREPKVLYY